ncbi:MAG TPA: hypothetical protein ENI37_08380 [Chloroflexi bacterium]|nr:hypothetical protein [Chloroflexota bacterium]
MGQPIERADSSAVCMRGVAAALRGQFLDPFEIPLFQRLGLSLVALFGPEAVRRAVGQGVRFRGTDPTWAERLGAEALARWAVSLYEGLDIPFDALIVGAPNGGVAHIAAALGAPFLSQHFLVSFRDPTHPDDVRTYFDHGTALARRILLREPMVAVVNHYDPLHDRYLVRWVNHIRIKLLDLPEAYRDFIRRRLRPGGTLVFSDCRYPWLQYRVGPRHTFQVGGLGGVKDREFLEGRPEIESLRRAPGGWSLPDMHLEVQAESEWGAVPPLREVVETFARAHGYRFLPLQADHPEWYARLALAVHRRLSEKEGREPAGALIEMFTQSNPVAPLVARLLPLWLPFNCADSLHFLREMRKALPDDRPVFFTPLSNFVQTFDTVGWGAYQEALAGLDLRVLGVRERLFPSDPAGLWQPARALARRCAGHPDPVRARLEAEELGRLVTMCDAPSAGGIAT